MLQARAALLSCPATLCTALPSRQRTSLFPPTAGAFVRRINAASWVRVLVVSYAPAQLGSCVPSQAAAEICRWLAPRSFSPLVGSNGEQVAPCEVCLRRSKWHQCPQRLDETRGCMSPFSTTGAHTGALRLRTLLHHTICCTLSIQHSNQHGRKSPRPPQQRPC